MAIVKLVCEKLTPGEAIAQEAEVKVFLFDTLYNRLWTEEGQRLGLTESKQIALDIKDEPIEVNIDLAAPWSKDNPPKKSRKVQRIKIQMGMSCNYECAYCSQRFVDRPVQGNPEKVDDLIFKIVSNFELPEAGHGLSFEFWGGEPFVYWKTFKPMAEKLRELFPDARMSTITNGSLLTRDIVDWLDVMGFTISISHDGPGQHVRGPCPIEDGSEQTKDAIAYAVEKLIKKGRGTFNPMLNAKNRSRLAIRKWFEARYGADLPSHGEGGLIDSYDDDGLALALGSKAEHFDFRRTALKDLLSGEPLHFMTVEDKIKRVVSALVENHKLEASTWGQKCGMERDDNVAMDMDGNIITCQNVSSVQTAPNGASHNCGNIDDLNNVRMRTATHWADRPHCQKCPVLKLCAGGCMFLEGDNWFVSCDNSFSDNVVFLAMAVLNMTGYLPVFIDADHLPDHRKDIWGSILEHKETKKRRPFPVTVVAK